LGIKNPELLIDGTICDNKRIEGEAGVTNGFNKALRQGCQSVVIDLDAHLKRLHINDLSIYLSEKNGLWEGRIKMCYVVYRGKAIAIATGDKKKKKTLSLLQ
jgi:hypothetical protein